MAKSCCKYFTVSLVPVASLTLAVLFALGIIVLPILYVHLADHYKYAVVIDAGSSHTKMYFYRWTIPRDKFTGEIHEIDSCKTPRSLNNYSSNPEKAGELFDQCIDKSRRKEYVPNSERKTTELFLGATAGMRLVRRNDSEISEEILKSANTSLREHSGYKLTSGRIISGQEEAVGGWITGNFLSQSLEKSSRPLTGSLDLGGASAQIAFQQPAGASSEYDVSVRLFGKDHSLYARSYLCFGQNEARLRLLAHLVNTSDNTTGEIENPCLLRGAKNTYLEDTIFSSVCVKTDTSSDVFGFGYSPPPRRPSLSAESSTNYTFVGTGDPEQCNATVQEVFSVVNCSDASICSNSTYQWPPVNNNGTFLGMSAFYYAASFFNNSGIELHNLTNFTATVQAFCNLTNTTALSWHHEDSYFQERCFNGIFSLFLLQTGFGFNNSNSQWTLKFEKKVHDMTVGWAMGYLLNQTNTIPDNPHQVERPFSAVDLVVGILVLSILCFVFVVFFFLTFHACRKVLKTRGGYSHLS